MKQRNFTRQKQPRVFCLVPLALRMAASGGAVPPGCPSYTPPGGNSLVYDFTQVHIPPVGNSIQLDFCT